MFRKFACQTGIHWIHASLCNGALDVSDSVVNLFDATYRVGFLCCLQVALEYAFGKATVFAAWKTTAVDDFCDPQTGTAPTVETAPLVRLQSTNIVPAYNNDKEMLASRSGGGVWKGRYAQPTSIL